MIKCDREKFCFGIIIKIKITIHFFLQLLSFFFASLEGNERKKITFFLEIPFLSSLKLVVVKLNAEFASLSSCFD